MNLVLFQQVVECLSPGGSCACRRKNFWMVTLLRMAHYNTDILFDARQELDTFG